MKKSNLINRRQWTQLGALLATGAVTQRSLAAPARKFTLDLCPGRIGAGVGQAECIELAAKHGFESVEPNGAELARMDESGRKKILEQLKQKGLVWGAGGLPIQFREDESKFQTDLKAFVQIAKSLNECGVTRIGTWLMPCHATLTYLQNFDLHQKRLQSVAKVLEDFDLFLGLEYVGTKTLRTSKRFTFIHCLEETRELLDAIGSKNVGIVLDSWHWYAAQETEADLLTVKASEVAAVDLNDAPAGLSYDEQIDNQRTLPMETGVIDTKAFLQALITIGYDGPVRAEPFSAALNAMDNEPAVAKTAAAMKKAFELVS